MPSTTTSPARAVAVQLEPGAQHLGSVPAEISSFIGRRREIADVVLQLKSSRLVTLTGPGGVGKSRLALRVTSAVRERYADGAWFIQLEALSQPELLPRVLATGMGLLEDPHRTAHESLVDYLRPRHLLLVLDNCEHLIETCADLVHQLLAQCSELTVLATSRQPLRLMGELTFVVPSLPVPTEQDIAEAADPRQLYQHFGAIQLFVDRASASGRGFELTTENARFVKEICARLDGIPLAVELAAARTQVLSAQQIASRLGARFSLLVAGSRTGLQRHRTLQAALDWSYDLLSPEESAFFRSLSVLAGDWSLDVAEALLGRDVTDTLASLVDKSLVVATERNGEMRYRLLETTREYALFRLVESGEDDLYQRRRFNWCLSIARGAERDYWKAEQWTSCARVEREYENIRAAFEWTQGNPDRAELGVELAGTLWHFWDLMGHLRECSELLRRLLAMSSQRTAARAKALAVYGWLPVPLGEGPPDERMLSDSVEISRELGLVGLAALSLGGMVHALVDRSELSAGSRTQAESFQLAEEAGDPVAMWVALEAGAVIARARADFERALGLLRKARAIAIEQGDDYARVRVEAPLVRLYLARGELENAERVCVQRIHDGLGPRGTLFVLEALGWIASARGDLEQAARLLGAAHSARERSGVRLFYIDDLEEHERAMARLRQLDTGQFEAVWTAGEAATLSDLLAEDALGTGVSQLPARRVAGNDGLTGRELQILRLIAQGSSNRDIATRLDLSVRTVERHITNVYTKIGARGKADATAYVFRHGLDSP